MKKLFGPLLLAICCLMVAATGCNAPLEICQPGGVITSCTSSNYNGSQTPPALPPTCPDLSTLHAYTCPEGAQAVVCEHLTAGTNDGWVYNWTGYPSGQGGAWHSTPEWGYPNSNGCTVPASGSTPTRVCLPSCPGFRPNDTVCGALPGRASKWTAGGVDHYFTTPLTSGGHLLIPGKFDGSACGYWDARLEDNQYGSFYGTLYLPQTGAPYFIGVLYGFSQTYSPVVVSF